MSVERADPSRLAPPLERMLLVRLLVGLVLLVGGVAALGWAFREPMLAVAQGFVDRLGVWGLFFGMFLIDSYAFPPLAHEPILFFAHAGGIGFYQVAFLGGLGSFLAGMAGYGVGRLLARVPWVIASLERTGMDRLMAKRGVWVVALAAISPIPFSASAYAAGALRVPFGPFVLACTLRFPKVLAYLGVIAFGWSLG